MAKMNFLKERAKEFFENAKDLIKKRNFNLNLKRKSKCNWKFRASLFNLQIFSNRI